MKPIKMKTQILLAFLIIVSVVTVRAQDSYFPDRVASSPTAAGLISAIEFPVDLSSGKPSISIPLYTIERDGIRVPISLSYNAQGIKVNQVAGYAGLNWNFNAGGSVTRLVNGLHDEHARGYMSGNNDIADVMDVCSSSSPNVDEVACNAYMLKAEHPDFDKIDLKPDEFYFQFGEYSGKFFYDQELDNGLGGFVFQSRQDLAVKYYSGPNGIIGFRFTTPHGAKYYFGVESESDTSPILETKLTSGILHSNNMSSPINSTDNDYSSLWPIRRIVSPNGQEITFQYSLPYTQAYNTKGGEWLTNDNGIINNIRIERHRITKPLLESIDFGIGKVNIASWAGDRLDYLDVQLGNDKGVALGSLEVVDQNNHPIKKYNFNYDHYSTTESLPYYVNGSIYEDGVRKRLRLRSVQEEGNDGGLLPPYLFDYNGDFLPSLYNTGQDFWGYYNGQPNGNYVKRSLAEPAKKRFVNPVLSSVGILNKITYPTGGYKILTYESNRGLSVNMSAGPQYYDTKYENVTIEKIVGENPSDSEYWDNVAGKYIINFDINADVISGETRLSMLMPAQCSGPNPNCPYMVMLDGVVYPYAPNTSLLQFTSGSHTLEVIPTGAHSSLPPEEDEFKVTLIWKEPAKLSGDELYMGGLRVKRVSSYDVTDELLFQKDYYYKLGKSISLPSFIENIYIENGQLPCTSANQFGNVELVGSGYEYPHYQEVYEDNFRTLSEDLPDGSPIPPYSKVVSRFDSGVRPDNTFYLHPYPSPNDLQFQMNKLVQKKYYNDVEIIKIEEYEYLEDVNNYYQQDHITGIAGFRSVACSGDPGVTFLNPTTYKLYWGLDQVQHIKEVTYGDNSLIATVSTKKDYDSDEHSQLTRTTISGSVDNIITEYFYADDAASIATEYLGGNDTLNQLSKNGNLYRPAIPLITKSYRSPNSTSNGQLVSNSQLIYDGFGFVSEQWSAIGDAGLERNFIITKRNSKGKPREVIGRDGVINCFIWGYDGELLIGKVSGISYDIISQDVDGLITLSNADIDETTEDALRAGIQSFITTYPEAHGTFVTYDPLIGVTSQVDANGITTHYKYDEFNRLVRVVDQDENVVQLHEYNYFNSPSGN